MANVIRCASDLGGADAYVYLDAGPMRDEMYITFDVYISQALVTASAADGYVGDICHVAEIGSPITHPSPSGILVGLAVPSNPFWVYQDSINSAITASPVDTWQTVSIHYLKDLAGGPAVKVGTVDYGASAAETPHDQIDGAVIGLIGPSANTQPLYLRNIKFGTTGYGSSDLFSASGSSLAGFTSTSGDVSVVADPTVPPTNNGGVRVGVAFNDVTLEETPVWTWLTDTANVVAGYDISRGGESEFDHTNASSVTVKLNDQDGLLDPTNSSGPYYGLIEPLLQIIIQLWNPVTEEWFTRFRGFIEDYDYDVEPWAYQDSGGDTVGVTRLTISCVDLEAILVPIEMQPDGSFGDPVPFASTGNIFFDNASAHDRITQVFADAGIPTSFYVVFTLNVNMPESVYSPGANVMEVIQDAVDAEFPTVANRYIDRLGRMAIHGRLAKFDPDGTAAGASPGAWDFTRWKAGDGKAVALSSSDTAHLRTFAFNRGMSKVYNSALCTPNGIAANLIGAQFSQDAPSVAKYGIRSWSAENLFIESGTLTGNTALQETALFGSFITTNYAEPRNRITDVTFRTIEPSAVGAAANWDLLCRLDISDVVEVTVSLPGGGGLSLEPFFVEGIVESCEPLNGEYANVTVRPSLSPLTYFADPVGLDGV